ncbi:MAG TPA: RtcB family protein [Candidatus Hydrogenedentes bacterium]|nr:RtcB family protein [Candidatus Hydrogenedentota bacterium]
MKLTRIDDTTYEIAQAPPMRAPARIIADERLIGPIESDKAAEQTANVACLPGIVGHALAMPDAHWGYGFPIGGVAATDPDAGGVVSPGGVGYDINCGVRLMATQLAYADIAPRLRETVNALYRDIPAGVGSSGAIPKLGEKDLRAVLEKGARWAVERGYGSAADLDTTEENGCMTGADSAAVSSRAMSRGADQLGTLGSGNHFVELGVVERVLDERVANVFGLFEGQVTLMIHSGSRGLGYQVCDDFLDIMVRAAAKYGIRLPDKQLCCAPVHAEEGREYLAAMASAANFAWANRQIMMELARRSLQHALKVSPRELGGRLLYDVCHNIAKFEMHEVGGVRKRLCVHRKGATRAFPAGHPDVPAVYRAVGQPVLVPGDMGTGSYVCVGAESAMKVTFGSSCHGAGRVLSRTAARKSQDAGKLLRELADHGVTVMARSRNSLTEESPEAYKDIDAVVEVIERAGLARRVVRIRPVGVVKG